MPPDRQRDDRAAVLRAAIWRELDPSARAHGLSRTNRVVCILILCSVLVAVLETEPSLADRLGGVFWAAEFAFATVFAVEYGLRAWVAIESPRFQDGWRGRLRYLATPAAVLDLLALLPALLLLTGSLSFLLRLGRLVRILRLARLGPMTRAIDHLRGAVAARRYELGVSLAIAAMVLLVSSCLLYVVEGPIQPEDFGSIPRAMWWSIATLTTVGYGDVYPITPLGKVLAAITALSGIGLIAMPTGILAAAFSDAMVRARGGATGTSEGPRERL